MKKLGIAIGNSNIICGYYDKNKENILVTERFSHDEYEKLSKFKNEVPVIASVVPNMEKKVTSIFENYIYAKSSMKSNYKTAGIDRLLVCEGALLTNEPPLIVVDTGTAITINVVDGENTFLGGSILPGFSMALNSLSNAALLPLLDLKKEAKTIGTNTEEAIFSGVIKGTSMAITGMIEEIKKELNIKNIIITGGGSEILLKYINNDLYYDRELLMKALLNFPKKY